MESVLDQLCQFFHNLNFSYCVFFKKKKVICFLSETTYTEKVAVCVFFTVRYETLAVATEAESRQDPNLPLKTGGKRLTVSTNTHIFYFFFDMIVCLSVLWLVFKDCRLSDIWISIVLGDPLIFSQMWIIESKCQSTYECTVHANWTFLYQHQKSPLLPWIRT